MFASISLSLPRSSRTFSAVSRRAMSSSTSDRIHFGPFEVTNQVFLRTRHSFALVNIKPLLPGHVLVCPLQPHKRLTDLTIPEVTDLFATTQRVQRMLARYYFPATNHASHQQTNREAGHPSTGATDDSTGAVTSPLEAGSFNIALQDGAQAGQTVPHVHVHILPRIPGATGKEPGPSDEIYELMAKEEGNVGGGLWDAAREEKETRPQPGGGFPKIEDDERKPRSAEEMNREAEVFRSLLKEMGEA